MFYSDKNSLTAMLLIVPENNHKKSFIYIQLPTDVLSKPLASKSLFCSLGAS